MAGGPCRGEAGGCGLGCSGCGEEPCVRGGAGIRGLRMESQHSHETHFSDRRVEAWGCK